MATPSVNLLANEVLFALKRLYGAENDPERDHEAIGIISKPLREAADEVERLRAALMDARNALHNDFEPDNQSRAWHRANDALTRA